jgi:hypothetical protein
VKTYLNTETSARQQESGLLAAMLLPALQAASSTSVDMPRPTPTRSHLIPHFLLIGENTENTFHQRIVSYGPQTGAGGEGISKRAQERSLLLSRIEGFMELPKDWGGKDTILIDQMTLEFARNLVRDLPEKCPFPQATSSSEGEIAFTWFSGENRLEAVLHPDHHLVWVVKKGGKYDGRDIDLSIPVFSDLFEAVAQFYK